MSDVSKSVFTWQLELQITLRSLGLLFRELSLTSFIRLVTRIVTLQVMGEPFRGLPAATTPGEIFSRRQIGPAIVLYKALRYQFSEQRSLAIAKVIIIDSTLVFLREAVGAINRQRLTNMSDSDKQSWLDRIAGQFLNATIRWNQVGHDSLSFTITHCYFPSLCRKSQTPELAPLFCQGDAVYFGEEQEGIVLTRPHTIAKGAADCLFEMELVQLKTGTSPIQ